MAVSGVPPAVAVAVGETYACALTTEGRVSCWGNGGPARESLGPALVPGIEHAVDIAVGGYHACAVTKAGAARCWGDNASGEVGVRGARIASATVVPFLTDVIDVTTTADFGTCAVTRPGAVWCWGGTRRHLEDASAAHEPRRLPGVEGIVSLADGSPSNDVLTAIRKDGGVVYLHSFADRLEVREEGSLASATRVKTGAPLPCGLAGGKVRCAPSPLTDGRPTTYALKEPAVDLAVTMEQICVLTALNVLRAEPGGSSPRSTRSDRRLLSTWRYGFDLAKSEEEQDAEARAQMTPGELSVLAALARVPRSPGSLTWWGQSGARRAFRLVSHTTLVMLFAAQPRTRTRSGRQPLANTPASASCPTAYPPKPIANNEVASA